jgi:hypothetical protein
MKKLWLEISKIQKLQILFLVSLFISTFYIIYIAYIFAPGKFLKIKFLDVGQGDRPGQILRMILEAHRAM